LNKRKKKVLKKGALYTPRSIIGAPNNRPYNSSTNNTA